MNLPDPGITLYIGAIGLIAIGIAGIVIAKNLFRILLALVIALVTTSIQAFHAAAMNPADAIRYE